VTTGEPAPPLSGTVLVTGASGFLGSNLVRRLLESGANVRVLVRTAAKARPLVREGAQPAFGEITDRGVVERALEGVEVVYHLAGRLLVPGVAPTEYWRTHVQGTGNLLDSSRRVGTIRRFIHCSTTGVLGTTGDRPAHEGTPLRPTNVYEATKAEAERAVVGRSREGFPAVIARPGLVYGPGDLHLLPFFDSVLRRRFRPIGRRPVWLHPIYIDDLTEALIRCGAQHSAVGECFHLAGPEPVALAELARAIARAGGTRVPAGYIPVCVARVAAAVADALPSRLRRSAPLTRTRLEFLTHSRAYDVSKARRLLGFTARTDLQTGMALTVAWYRRQGYLGAS
jgi:nucleoside-diphosphate-sugar epimerase